MADPHADSHLSTYNRIILVLSGLTFIEFAIAFSMKPGDGDGATAMIGFTLGLLLLVGLAGWKAVLVARFFMHIKYDPRFLAWIILSPVALAFPLILIPMYDAVHGPAF